MLKMWILHNYHLIKTNLNKDLNTQILWLNDQGVILINWLNLKIIMQCSFREVLPFSFLWKVTKIPKYCSVQLWYYWICVNKFGEN